MNKIIVVCGLGGTGKTTLANALAKRTGLVCLHKDSIKAALYDELNFQTKDTYKLFHNIIEEQLSNHANLIIEATFTYEGNIEMMRKWREQYNFDLYWVVCNIDTDTRVERIRNRERHDCHKEADQLAIENSIHEESDFNDLPGHSMRITTNKTTDILVDEILQGFKMDFTSPNNE